MCMCTMVSGLTMLYGSCSRAFGPRAEPCKLYLVAKYSMIVLLRAAGRARDLTAARTPSMLALNDDLVMRQTLEHCLGVK